MALVVAFFALGPTSFASMGARASTGAAADNLGHDRFREIAERYLAERGVEADAASRVKVDDLMARNFVHARVGLFEVHLPDSALADHAQTIKDALLALLDAQELWLEWMEPVLGKQRDALKDLAAVRKEIGRWKTGAGLGLSKIRDAGGNDLFALAGSKEKPVEAAARFADFMTSGAAVGVERDKKIPARLCLLPTRKGFVEFLAFAGYANDAVRETFWQDAVLDWTMGFVDDLQLIALEYSAAHRPEGVYEQGEGMNERSPTGMQEQVVQLAANSLCEQFFGPRAPKAFSQGLSMNLVIELYHEIVTRVDGDMRANQTMAREVFVPGGASEGGFLGMLSAESRWREQQGSDYFVSVLRAAQIEGQKNAERTSRKRTDCFALRSDKGGDIHVVCAPLLGSAAATQAQPPENFQGDWAEFLRAYKSCFMYWLQHQALRKKSDERFAELLQRLADPEGGGFEEAFVGLYDGAPLSGEAADDDTLEGRFLVWLGKQK
jgi:hypothetical protein